MAAHCKGAGTRAASKAVAQTLYTSTLSVAYKTPQAVGQHSELLPSGSSPPEALSSGAPPKWPDRCFRRAPRARLARLYNGHIRARRSSSG